MNTIVIWNVAETIGVKYFLLKGNFSYLDNVYINTCGSREYSALVRELDDLVFDENGTYKVFLLDKFPIHEILNDNMTKVVCCGILP